MLAAGEGLRQTGVQQWEAYPYYLPGVAVMNASGAAGGGHVGWNYQFAGFSRFVAGLETDALVFAGNGGHTSTFVTPGGLNPSIAQIGRAMPWAGSTRARVGFLITPSLLVYGTGGAAFGAANVNEYAYGSALAATYAPGGAGRIYGGWAAGGGLEWAFLSNWSARVEYLHADLGTHAASFPGFVYGSVPSFPVAAAVPGGDPDAREHGEDRGLLSLQRPPYRRPGEGLPGSAIALDVSANPAALSAPPETRRR